MGRIKGWCEKDHLVGECLVHHNVLLLHSHAGHHEGDEVNGRRPDRGAGALGRFDECEWHIRQRHIFSGVYAEMFRDLWAEEDLLRLGRIGQPPFTDERAVLGVERRVVHGGQCVDGVCEVGLTLRVGDEYGHAGAPTDRLHLGECCDGVEVQGRVNAEIRVDLYVPAIGRVDHAVEAGTRPLGAGEGRDRDATDDTHEHGEHQTRPPPSSQFRADANDDGRQDLTSPRLDSVTSAPAALKERRPFTDQVDNTTTASARMLSTHEPVVATPLTPRDEDPASDVPSKPSPRLWPNRTCPPKIEIPRRLRRTALRLDTRQAQPSDAMFSTAISAAVDLHHVERSANIERPANQQLTSAETSGPILSLDSPPPTSPVTHA